MRRVVISGLGVVSCLGNSQDTVLDSLRAGRSGITFNDSFAEMGLRSNVSGQVDIDLRPEVSRINQEIVEVMKNESGTTNEPALLVEAPLGRYLSQEGMLYLENMVRHPKVKTVLDAIVKQLDACN